jgi:hypothetical protein
MRMAIANDAEEATGSSRSYTVLLTMPSKHG